jgi:gliding motility-associated-like protein
MGSTAGFSPSGAPFCPGAVINNDQWFGFIAGAAGATFTVTPSNCTLGDGVQLAVYPGGCNDEPIGCNAGCANCGNTPQTVTVAMTPGTNYYLLIDGYGGDECDVTITVAPPIAVQAPPIGASGTISGPATGCPGGSGTYSLPLVTNAGFYTWSSPTPGVLFNGLEGPVTFEAPGGRTVIVTYPPGVTGNITICVEPSSSCFTGTERCRTINIQPLPATTLPKAVVCNEDAPYILPWGDEVNASGPYQTTYTSYQGCDSLVRQQVQILPKIITNLTRFVCSGTCVSVCGQEFCDQGLYPETCDSYLGCDSTVNLTLNVLAPVADITSSGILSCNNNSVTLNSAASPNFPGVSVKVWRILPSNAAVGNGNSLVVTTPGTYTLTTTMSAGAIQCSQSDTITITGNTIPPTAVGVNGVIGCASGPIQIGVTTNAPNPSFSWSGNVSNPNIQSPTVSTGGTYVVTVTSGLNGCTATANATIVGNTTPPTVTTAGALINCTSPAQQISASVAAPATATFAWSGPTSGTGATLNVTAPGVYVVTATDISNNCTTVASATVVQDIALPGALAAASGIISCPTPLVTLNGNSPAATATYNWSGPGLVGNGQSPMANLAGTYTVTVTGANGCTSTATTTVDGNTTLPNATATGVTLSCNTPNSDVVANSTTGGVSYAWSIGGNTINSAIANVNLPGSYTVTVTAGNGCTSTAVALADGNFAAPNASATGATISCGVNTVSISGNSSTAGVAYSWIGPGNTPFTGQNINVSTVGTYTLVVTSANGCTTTATTDVIPDANIPNLTVVGDTINCLNANAVISGASTTPGVTFTWTFNGSPLPNPSSQTQMITQNGLYTLTVINPANGCTAVATAFVELDTDAPGASTQDATLTCSMSSLNLAASSPLNNVTYTWPGGNSGAIFNVTGPGTYTVTVTAPNGCTSTAVANVAADQGIPVLTTTAATLTCAVPVVSINTTSTVPAVFSWTGPAGFQPTSQQSPPITDPGTYTVNATASNGCSSTASITVNQDIAPPNAGATGGVLTCSNASLALSSVSSTPNTTFFWQGLNTGNQNPTVSVVGDYVVLVTGSNGCTSSATAVVTENKEKPNVTIASPTELTCSVLSSTVTPTIDPLTNTIQGIVWSNGAITQDISVAAPGTYTVTVTLDNGCTQTAVASVPQDIVVPNATATGGTLSCNFPSINITGNSNTFGSTLSWTGGLPPTTSPAVTVNGTYILTVTGTNGCTQTASAVVAIDTIAPGASIVSSNIINCKAAEATLTANTTTGISYDWTGPNVNSASSPDIVALVAGTYSVVTTGTNGCKSTATFTQVSDLAPPAAVTTTGATLDCISGVATITSGSSTPGVSYRWEGPAPFISNQQNPTVTVPGTYTVTVKGTNGCTSTAIAEVLANTQSPNADIDNSTTLLTCAVTSIDLTGTTVTPSTTVQWTLPDNTTSPAATIAATEPGAYQFQVTSTVNGCITIVPITLTQNITPPVVQQLGSGVLDCNNPTVTLNGGSDVANATYLWTGPTGLTFPVEDPAVGIAGTYTVVVTNPGNGCTASATATVGSNPSLPTISVTANTITCLEPVITLDATTNVTNATYLWTGPAPFTSTLPDPTTDKPGAYTVVVRDPNNGCTSTFNITVVENKVAPNIAAQGGQVTCGQPSIQLGGASTTTGVTYLWTSPSGETFPIPTPTVSQPGTYTLVITNTLNGCSSSATATVTPDQNIPVVTVTGGQLTCKDPELGLTGETNKPDVTWAWSGPAGFNSEEKDPLVTEPGTYTLIVTTPINGCTGQASVVVTQDKVNPVINVANPDQLDCGTTQVNLGATVAVAGNYTYNWTTVDGNILAGAATATPTVSAAAIYNILVTNTNNGCTSTRDVEVSRDPATPSAVANQPKGISCYGYTDGAVSIGGVTGGTEPYLFSVDNQPFIAASAFTGLPPGPHSLRVLDANSCEFETTFIVPDREELIVTLEPDTTIRLGDEITLSIDGTVNYPDRIERAVLSPAYLDTLLGTVFVPTYSLQYKLTVIDSNGCRADDIRTIIVDRTRRVYVPNVFNPNGSGSGNDLLRIFGGNDVLSFKSFSIFDRWGEAVFQARNFGPNDANTYWDGKLNGKLLDPAVFVYVVEVLFKDGEVEIYSGDISVTR